MELTVQKTIKKKVIIELPHYVKSPAHFYKVVSKDNCIQVYCGATASIGIHHAGLAFVGEGNETSDEFEFEEAFKLAINQIHKAIYETV
jgi:hypothetical protein